jgi:hypothetical protein
MIGSLQPHKVAVLTVRRVSMQILDFFKGKIHAG